MIPQIAEVREGEAISAILFRRIGDSLLATPALRALKVKYPKSNIHVFCESHVARVFDNLSFVDEIHSLDKSPSPILLATALRRIPRLAAVVDFLSDPRSALASRLSGARYRVGFARSFRQLAYNLRVPLQDTDAPIYSAVHKLNLAHAIGAMSEDLNTVFKLSDENKAVANAALKHNGVLNIPLVAFFVSSRRDYKRWPIERFAEVSASIQNSQRFTTIVIGGPGERNDAIDFCQRAGLSPDRVIILDNIGDMAAILEHCAALICNDGGPKHLAVAVGTPTVAVFQNDPWQYWTPPDDPRHVAVGGSGMSPSVDQVMAATWKVIR